MDVPAATPISQLITIAGNGMKWFNLHPTPLQLYPGKQHPPLSLPGQLEYPLLVSHEIDPEHVCPCGQHPTDPNPVSGTFMQISVVPQQLFGALSDVHALVPSGHLKSRLKRDARGAIRSIGSKRLDSECGRKGDIAKSVPFPISTSDLLVLLFVFSNPSPANIQLSSMNISPGSSLIFLTPIGVSFCNLS